MTLKFVVDMNLSPKWVDLLSGEGWPSIHWSNVGAASAPDGDIMDWARANARAVFTFDLGFGTALALSGANGPSVIQVRGKRVRPPTHGVRIANIIRNHEAELVTGALIVIDEFQSRIRVLPLQP